MRLITKKLLEAAHNEKISDANFRKIVLGFDRPDIKMIGCTCGVDKLVNEAIIDTERDLYVK